MSLSFCTILSTAVRILIHASYFFLHNCHLLHGVVGVVNRGSEVTTPILKGVSGGRGLTVCPTCTGTMSQRIWRRKLLQRRQEGDQIINENRRHHLIRQEEEVEPLPVNHLKANQIIAVVGDNWV